MIDITINITDRDGNKHQVSAPTDMAMNLMEVVRSYELAPEGTIGAVSYTHLDVYKRQP